MSNGSRRWVFVSYHHADQAWKDHFVEQFCTRMQVFHDGSLDDRIDSTQPDYVHRQIREDYITGTSVTIVLCGAETWKRRYIDWEIHSTLHKRHGLLGIVIPNTPAVGLNSYRVPDRLKDNIPGYAARHHWPASAAELQGMIEASLYRSNQIAPDNSRAQMANNRP